MATHGPFLSDPHQWRYPLGADRLHRYSGIVRRRNPHPCRGRFKDGKAVRWIDYWDGRSFGAETAAKMRTPPDKFPTNFDYDVASEGASTKIKDMSQKLASAFASGDAIAAAALFTNDAVYLDRALRVRILGNQARSASTSPAYWQRHHTARDQCSCTSLVSIRAAASSGRTTEAR